MEWKSKDVSVPDFLLRLMEPKLNLKEWCRLSIRKHLINLDAQLNLFHRIIQLGLPPPLVRYLLYNMSLDEAFHGGNYANE